MSIAAPTTGTDWECQRAFLAVMREGSLSAAARALNVAQPTVRRRIEDLERQHRVVLFTRSPTGLQPTAIAAELAAHVETMSISDDGLVSTIGLLVDDASNTVWVTNPDPDAGINSNPTSSSASKGPISVPSSRHSQSSSVSHAADH